MIKTNGDKRETVTGYFFAASLAMGWGLVAGLSSAQTAGSFPNQSVCIISPFPAGSGPDVVARIVGEKLVTALGTKMVHVPYKEMSQLYAAVSTGEIDWAMGSIASAGPLLKAGQLRFIAIADDARAASMPNVPTVEESAGPKGIKARTSAVLMAPKATPGAVVDVLNCSLNDALKQPDVMEKFANFGFVPDLTTPAALTTLIDSDTLVYADMVKRSGASAD